MGRRRQTAFNVSLSRLTPEQIQALIAAGYLARQPDGTLIALSHEPDGEPVALAWAPPSTHPEHQHAADDLDVKHPGKGDLKMSHEDQMALALAAADEGGYGDALRAALGADPGDDVLTPLELSQAEDAFAVSVGGAVDDGFGGLADPGEVSLAGERERILQHHAEMRLRDAGNRFAAPRTVDALLDERRVSMDEVPLSRWDIDQAIEDAAGFSNSIPEASTSWDGGLGERADALSRVARAVQGQAPGEDEVLRLTGEYADLIGLAAGNHEHDHSDGTTHTHDHVHNGDADHDHHYHPLDLRGSAELEIERLARQAADLGMEVGPALKVSRRYHGRPGTRVTSNQRAHAREVHTDADGGTDHGQPRQGNRPHPGVRGGIYDSGGIGAPEEISGRPVLSDRSGRVPTVADPYHAPRGKPQAPLGMSGGLVSDPVLLSAGRDGEYWDSGSPAEILARHAGRF